MKVAIAAKGTTLGSQIDPRFGRAAYFLLIDTDSGRCEPHDNCVNAQSVSGAGVQAAMTVVDLGVDALITGHVGPNALGALRAASVRVYAGVTGTAQDALRRYEAEQYAPVGRLNLESHSA